MAGTLYEGMLVSGVVVNGGTTTHTVIRPLELYDADNYATATNGGGSIQIQTTGGNFTDVMTCNTENNLVRASDLTAGNKLAAAATTLSFVGGSSSDGVATVYCFITGSGINFP
jgi:hypothetical protein